MGNAGIGKRLREGQGARTGMALAAGEVPGNYFIGKAPFAFSVC